VIAIGCMSFEDWRTFQMCCCDRVGEVVYGKYQGDWDDQLLGKISLAQHAENAGLISDSSEENRD
jgi:hypothetical protein